MPRSRATTVAHPRLVPIAVAVSAALAAPAWAQEARPGSSQLETITVTAERRSEDIKDVPNSVSAIRGEYLDVLNSSGQDVRMLATKVPSLNIESSFGRAFPRFYIRGIGNTDFDLNASQPVSLVFDDVVQENPILKGFPLFDIEQIEVLRGPQGTLFGRNSPAGVVKFDSVRPRQAFEGYANIGTGSFNAANFDGALNVPLNKEWALRVAAQFQHRGDWVDNTYAPGPNRKLEGYDDSAGRAQLLYAPNGTFSALFNLHGRHLDGTARLFRANIIKPGTNDLVDGFNDRQVSYDGHNEQNLDEVGGSVRLRWDMGSMNLQSITGYEKVKAYSRGDIDGGFGAVFAPPSGPGFIPFPSESADGLPKHRQLSQEFRLASKGQGFDWLLGAYFFKENITIDSFSYDTLAGGPVNGYAQQKQENKAAAVYGSVTVPLASQWSARAGLRYTRDQKDFSAIRTLSPIGGTAIGPLTANPSDNDLSGDASITFAVDKNTNLYARAARGFRAPSIQGRILFGDTLSQAKSEHVDSLEAGIKSEMLDRRVRLAFTVFGYEVKDQQLTAVGGAANFNQLVNAKKTTGSGMELDLQAVLAPHLLGTLAASYNKTEIKDPDLRIQPCGAPCTVLDPKTPGGTVSVNGNPLPNAPKMVYNGTLRYSIPMGDNELYFFTDWAYRSKINFFLYESTEFTGKPLVEGGLRVGYKFARDQYEVALFGRNITNQIRVVGGIDFDNLTGMINEPRTWGVQFRANF